MMRFRSRSRRCARPAASRFAAEPLEPRTLLAAEMVLDVNPVTDSASPYGFTDVNGTLYFAATSPAGPQGLWKSDGTAAGTVPVFPPGTHPPGQAAAPSSPLNLTAVGSTLFFTDGVTSSPRLLWKTDGTPDGTVLLKQVDESGSLSSFTVVGDTLFFSMERPGQDSALWKTDGSVDGTVQLRGFQFGAGGIGPAQLQNVNGVLYFTADDGATGREPWRSDGTAAGTVQVQDVNPGPDSSWPAGYTPAGSTVVFSASVDGHRVDLWRSDGTPGGTARVYDIGPESFSAVDGVTYFTASPSGNIRELWRTDGTTAGTFRVAGPEVGFGQGSPVAFPFGGPGALFWKYDAGEATLYHTLGTAETTERIVAAPIAPVYNGPVAVSASGVLYFVGRAPDETGLASVWRTDGTAAGTFALTAGSFPYYPATVGDDVYFANDDGLHGSELWKSDGTVAGTGLFKDIQTNTLGSDPNGFRRAGDVAYFSAFDPAHGAELWKTDGTAGGTALVKDLWPGPESSAPVTSGGALLPSGEMLFVANAPGRERQLWKTDGTEAGTVVVKDIVPGLLNIAGFELFPSNGVVYFPAMTEDTGPELWRSDGTAEGTYLVKDIAPGAEWGKPTGFATLNGVMYFLASTAETGNELWRSDGTDEGTRLVADIAPGHYGSMFPEYADLTVVGGRLYFVARPDNNADFQVWSTDGTPAGTAVVPRTAGYPLGHLVAFNGKLFFTADGGGGGKSGLYRLEPDGKTTFVGAMDVSADAREMVAAGGQLFVVGDRVAGSDPAEYSLWKTDGTPEGTALVKTFLRARPGNLTAVGDELFFHSGDVRGAGLWRSDGTEAGTVQVSSLGGGTIVAMDDFVLFRGFESAHGGEPWRVGRGPQLAADAGGTYDVAEGDLTLNLSAAGSRATQGQSIVAYEWDFDYDGQRFDVDAVGQQATANLAGIDGPGARTVAVRVRDTLGATHVDTAVVRVANVPPTVSVTGPGRATPGEPYTLDLSATDPAPDTVHWRVDWGDGSPVQTFVINPARPTHRYTADRGSYRVTVTPSDEDGSYAPVSVFVTMTFAVAGRHVFYNGSAYDNNRLEAESADDAAVAPDKQPLLPGAGPGTFANVTSYARGINGLMVDLTGPAGFRSTPTIADFVFRTGSGGAPADWPVLAVAPGLTFRRFAGTGGSDRVTLTFPDNAVRNTWLQVTVLANSRTGLAAPDVFYFGNVRGETGDAWPIRVSALDLAGVKRALNRDSDLSGRFDFDRNGRINAQDLSAVRSNMNRTLAALSAPAPGFGTAPQALTPPRRPADDLGLLTNPQA